MIVKNIGIIVIYRLKLYRLVKILRYINIIKIKKYSVNNHCIVFAIHLMEFQSG